MADVSLDTSSTYKFEDLEQKYKGFFAPAFVIEVEGTNLILQNIAVQSVTVVTTVASSYDYCTFTVSNAYDWVKRDFNWVDDYFLPGKKIEVKGGYVDKLQSLFYGVITKVDFDFPQGGNPTISIRAADLAFLMQKGSSSPILDQKKYSDIASQIASTYGLTAKTDDSGITYEKIERVGKDDFTFLKELAARIDYEFFVVGKSLYFRKRAGSSSPVITLMWGKHLLSFRPSMDISSQVSAITVRGKLPLKPEYVEATSQDVTKIGDGSKTGKDMIKSLGEKKEYVYTNIETQEEAQKIANAMLNRRAMKLISGSGECIGLPEIRAGRTIKFDGLGKSFNREMYLTEVKHVIGQSGYKINFQVGGNAV